MRIKHKKTSLAPDSGDATLLQPSDWNQDHEVIGFKTIESDTTFNIKVDGTGSYPTLKACIDDLNDTLIHPSASVTIMLEAGIHVQSGIVEDRNLSRDIQIVGADVVNVSFSAATVNGSADNFSVTYTMIGSVPDGVTVGMFMTVHNNGADHTTGYYHFGCHEITALTATTLTCNVKNRNTPQTLSAVAVPCTIIKTVVKAGFSGESLLRLGSGTLKGYRGTPYTKNICYNAAGLVLHPIRICNSTKAILTNSTPKTYSLGAVNGTDCSLVILEQSYLECCDGAICLSSSANGGAWGMQQSFSDFGYYLIVTGCRGGNNWTRGVGTDYAHMMVFNPIMIDNRHTAMAANGGDLRYTTPLRVTYWGSNTSGSLGGNIIPY